MGLLLALTSLLIVWLWATGRIANVVAAIQGTPVTSGTSTTTNAGTTPTTIPTATSYVPITGINTTNLANGTLLSGEPIQIPDYIGAA
jgi:hypothetical protein